MKGNIAIDFDGDGEAEIPVVNLDFNISGKLKELYIHEGDQITKGQILAKLDDTQYEKKLKTAEINHRRTACHDDTLNVPSFFILKNKLSVYFIFLVEKLLTWGESKYLKV